MLNRITVMGRFVKDPELRATASGVSVVNFTLACDRDFKRDETDFFLCSAWRNTAEFIKSYFRKGDLIAVHGHLENNNFTDKDGNKRTTTQIVVDYAYFCGKTKAEGESIAADGNYKAPSRNSFEHARKWGDEQFTEIDPDGDLPF